MNKLLLTGIIIGLIAGSVVSSTATYFICHKSNSDVVAYLKQKEAEGKALSEEAHKRRLDAINW